MHGNGLSLVLLVGLLAAAPAHAEPSQREAQSGAATPQPKPQSGASAPQPKAQSEAAAPKLKAQRSSPSAAGSSSGAQALSADELRMQRRNVWHALMRNLRSPAELPAVVRAELRTHAWRLARLARIRSLALAAHDAALVQRSDQLLAREQTRHRERIARAWPAAPRKKRASAAAAGPHEDEDEDREREPDEVEEQERP